MRINQNIFEVLLKDILEGGKLNNI